MKEVDPRDVTNAALEFVLAINSPGMEPETLKVFKKELADALFACQHTGLEEEIINQLAEGVRVAASLKPLPTEASV